MAAMNRSEDQPSGNCSVCKWNKSEDDKYVRCCCPLVRMVNPICLMKNMILYLAPTSYVAEKETKDREESDWWKGKDDGSDAA